MNAQCVHDEWWTACVTSKLVNDMIPNKCPMKTHIYMYMINAFVTHTHAHKHAIYILKDEMKQQISPVINQIVLHKICIQITFLRVKKVMGKCLVILILERHHYHSFQSDMSAKCLSEMIFMQNINKNNKSSHKIVFSKYLFWHQFDSLQLANEWNMCISKKVTLFKLCWIKWRKKIRCIPLENTPCETEIINLIEIIQCRYTAAKCFIRKWFGVHWIVFNLEKLLKR